MYVLDTNTLIYFFKGIGEVDQKLLAIFPREIAIPSVVLYELEYGIAKSGSPGKRRAQIEELCSVVTILPFDLSAAKHAALVRVKLEKKGTPIGPYDVLIAGITLANQGILVTNNTKEFSRVTGLKLDNWYRA